MLFKIDHRRSTDIGRTGVTVGIDKGEVFSTELGDGEPQEYFGRPINVACRLQSSLDRVEHANKVLMSKRCYQEIKSSLLKRLCLPTTRTLKNVNNGKEVPCFELSPQFVRTGSPQDLRRSPDNPVIAKILEINDASAQVKRFYQIASTTTSTMPGNWGPKK